MHVSSIDVVVLLLPAFDEVAVSFPQDDIKNIMIIR